MAWNLYLERIAGTSSSLSEAYNQVMAHLFLFLAPESHTAAAVTLPEGVHGISVE